jgi:hypothetical protein
MVKQIIIIELADLEANCNLHTIRVQREFARIALKDYFPEYLPLSYADEFERNIVFRTSIQRASI